MQEETPGETQASCRRLEPELRVAAKADGVLVLSNPHAGGVSAQDRVDCLEGLLEQRGYDVRVVSELEEFGALACQWQVEGRLHVVVGVGGDGTAAELVNRTAPGTPIALLPTGTSNLLARHLELGPRPEDVVEAIVGGRLRRMDAGRANGRVFVLMVGCGLDAEVVRRVHKDRRGHISFASYVRPILHAIWSYEYPELLVYLEATDGRPSSEPPDAVSKRWVFVFNLPCYGSGIPLAPWADGGDGLLDVCAFRRGSFFHGVRYLGAVMLGRHQRMRECTTLRVRRVRVVSEVEAPYQLDGDPGGVLPVDIEVLPGRLTVLVPGAKDRC